MWEVKANVIPVIIGATGTILKSFRKYPRNNRKAHNQGNAKNSQILVLCTYFGKY